MDDTKPVFKKVSCGTVSLQRLRRIALPAFLTDNMQIEHGEELTVYFDPESKAAVLVKAQTQTQPAAKATRKTRAR